MRKLLLIATFLLVFTTSIFYLGNLNQTSTLSDKASCPTESNFTEFWNAWSYQYLTDNPNSDIDMQMEDWNTLVVFHGCGEEWLNPLDEMIEEHGASSTPVYWYDAT